MERYMDPGSEKACRLEQINDIRNEIHNSGDNVQEVYSHITDEYPEWIYVSILLYK